MKVWFGPPATATADAPPNETGAAPRDAKARAAWLGVTEVPLSEPVPVDPVVDDAAAGAGEPYPTLDVVLIGTVGIDVDVDVVVVGAAAGGVASPTLARA